ncbi:MAG TPA: SURF1 family cytochrome oxidase biogenesis protein [Allosphingosinicella sp.]|nr:SURF1 family cytochrome oxidase biogenesis protein [Allosphingosinicella sp.]
MRRLPIVPTLIVALAVATMIGLGVWQLQRARWKEGLLAQYAAAQAMPAVDLDPLLDGRARLPPLSFRRALVTCHADNAAPEIRAGRSAAGAPGQAYYLPCRPGAAGLAGRLRVNAGWAPRPDAVRRLSLEGLVAGRLGAVGEDGPVILTAAGAAPPLVPSRPPGLDTIPNNHRLYALQWFFFAAAAFVIYLLALRGRRRGALPPEP